jgi:hypothetical protein
MLRKLSFTVMAVGLLLLTSCTPKPIVTPTPTTSAIELQLQQQLTELSSTVSQLKSQVTALASQTPTVTLSSDIAKLQTQLNATSTAISNTLTEAQKAVNASTTTSNAVATLAQDVTALKASVTALQQAQAANTVIGTTPVNVNGLSVTFITNSVYLSGIGITTPSTVQLALKIANSKTTSLINVDIVGTITFSQSLTNLAPSYPILVDGDGVFTYNYYFNGTSTINFEVYSTKTGTTTAKLSIPKQSSITLRPRASLLASQYVIAAGTVTVSLSTISYDIGP